MRISDLNQLETVKRLKSLVDEKFQKNLEFKTLVSADLFTSQSCEKSEAIVSGNSLLMPFFYNSQHLLTAEIEDGAELNSEDREALTSMVHLVLDPVIIGWHLSHMNFTPDSFVQQSISGSAITLKPLSLSRTDTFILEGGRPQTMHKVAFELHDLKGNWSFLSWSQISSSVQTVQDLKDLGQVTVFIEDIGMLKDDELKLIEEFLELQLDESPLIIIGTMVPFKTLVESSALSERMIELLRNQLILVDALPLKMTLLREVLEFFAVEEAL